HPSKKRKKNPYSIINKVNLSSIGCSYSSSFTHSSTWPHNIRYCFWQRMDKGRRICEMDVHLAILYVNQQTFCQRYPDFRNSKRVPIFNNIWLSLTRSFLILRIHYIPKRYWCNLLL